MGTIADKLNYLEETKGILQESLAALGAEVSGDTPFSQYAALIQGISVGSRLNIAFGETAPVDTSMLWVKCDAKAGVTLLSSIADLPDGADTHQLYICADSSDRAFTIIVGGDNDVSAFIGSVYIISEDGSASEVPAYFSNNGQWTQV